MFDVWYLVSFKLDGGNSIIFQTVRKRLFSSCLPIWMPLNAFEYLAYVFLLYKCRVRISKLYTINNIKRTDLGQTNSRLLASRPLQLWWHDPLLILRLRYGWRRCVWWSWCPLGRRPPLCMGCAWWNVCRYVFFLPSASCVVACRYVEERLHLNTWHTARVRSFVPCCTSSADRSFHDVVRFSPLLLRDRYPDGFPSHPTTSSYIPCLLYTSPSPRD